MKVNIPIPEMKKALVGLGKIIARKATLPILNALRFDAAGNKAVVSATDLDQVAEYQFENARVDQPGVMILDYPLLKSIATGGANDVLDIESRGESAIIRNQVSGKPIERQVQTLDVADWPCTKLDFATKPAPTELLPYIRTLAPFASRDETRLVLNGVYLDVQGKNGHHLVATDGRRLTLFNSVTLPLRKNQILPVHKFLVWPKLEGETRVGFARVGDADWCKLTNGPWVYCARTIEGTYPNYRQVIPLQTSPHRVDFSEDDIALLNQVLPSFPGHDDQSRSIVFTGNRDSIAIHGRAPDDEQWTNLDLDNSRYTGPGGYVSVDRSFLLDALGAGFHRFEWADEMSPLKSTDGNGGLHVLMPMRVEGPPEIKPRSKQPVPVKALKKSTQPVPETNCKPRRRKENKAMIDKPKSQARPQGPDQLTLAFKQVKEKARELNAALSELGSQIKEAQRRDKTVKAELQTARGILGKLQSIKL